MGYRYELFPNWFTLDRQVRALDMIKNKKNGLLETQRNPIKSQLDTCIYTSPLFEDVLVCDSGVYCCPLTAFIILLSLFLFWVKSR